MPAPIPATEGPATRPGPPSADETLTPEGSAPPASAPIALARGQALGRYLVLGQLGYGGMGVVYEAYDPELDRKLAIKLLRAGSSEGEGGALLREAQALARLSHPNVVAVHDVGSLPGLGVFVAMELLQGQSLTSWLAAAKRGWREVLDVLVPAGRGLAAAHDAGIVHRDFKPDNVIVTDGGRVVVLDFGIATASDGSGSPTADGVAGFPIVGTPAFMAPEQAAGTAVDARADQYSFCLTLYLALFGVLPFDDHGHSLMSRALARPLRPPPAGVRVPARLRSAVLRGLAHEPAARFAAMDPLLAALERVRAHRGRRGVALLLGGALATGGVLWAGRRADPCADTEAPMDTSWSAEVRAATRAGLDDGTLPGASFADGVVTRMDTYARTWREQQQLACAADHGGDPQARATLRCLDYARQDFAVTARMLGAASAGLRANAHDVLGRVIVPEHCSDPQQRSNLARFPDDDATALEVARVRLALVEVNAAEAGGDALGAHARASALLPEAEALGFAPLVAEVLRARANAATGMLRADEAVADAEAAYDIFEAEGADLQSVHMLTALAFVHTVITADYSLAAWQLRQARAITSRMGDPPNVLAGVFAGQGLLLRRQGEGTEAIAVLERAVALHEAAGTSTTARLHAVALLIGAYQESTAHGIVAAGQLAERALAGAEDELGPGHVQRAILLSAIGRGQLASGHVSASIATLRRAEAIVAPLGAEHRNVLALQTMLASSLSVVDPRGALAMMSEFHPAARRAFGEASMQWKVMAHAYADLAASLGEHELALATDLDTLATTEAEAQAEPSLVALGRARVANDLLALGRDDEAATLLSAAEASLRQSSAPDVDAAPVLHGAQATLALRRGELSAARAAADTLTAAVGPDKGDNAEWRAREAAIAAAVWRATDEQPARRLEYVLSCLRVWAPSPLLHAPRLAWALAFALGNDIPGPRVSLPP